MDVLTLTTAALTGISTIAAAVAAGASLRQAKIAQSVHEADLFVRFVERYRSPQMNAALKRLATWWKENGREGVRAWNEARLRREPDALAVDDARRTVKAYFESVALLFQKGFVSRHFAVSAVDHGGIDVFFEVGEPLEAAINPANYPKWIFDTLRPLPIQYGHGIVLDKQN
ncbi:MAG TPA: hypothetical protein VG841_09540 [Caulobacterales bacterium]|nr:hypothetical protein [Caulobacterales bacterium]